MGSRSLVKSGKSISGSGSESTPDLRTIEDKDVALRKRKYECDCADMLADFRKEMFSFLREFTKTLDEKSEILHQEIKEIKGEIKGNSVVLQSVVAEQKHLKTELNNMKTLTDSIQQKICLVEEDLSKLKNNNNNTALSQNLLSYDDTILEVQDRSRREKNIVIAGISEPQNANSASRREHDKKEVMKVLNTIFPECPDPRVVFRLGKYNQSKNRALKVCFENPETAKVLLKNKSIATNIHIYTDQTPYQQQHIKNLRTELQSRQQKGEMDLIIKYFRGIPKIIKSSSINETHRKPTAIK